MKLSCKEKYYFALVFTKAGTCILQVVKIIVTNRVWYLIFDQLVGSSLIFFTLTSDDPTRYAMIDKCII